MNPREKRLASIVGIFAGVFVVVWGVKTFFIEKIENSKLKKAGYEKTIGELSALEYEKKKDEKGWRDDAARTFSFNETLAKDMLHREVKQIALRNGFDSPNVKTAVGLRVAVKSQFKSPAVAVTLIGEYAKVMAFMQDIYHAPFLCQITNVAVTPLGPRYGRNNVKLDISVESPVLPEKFKGVTFAKTPTTMPAETTEPMEPYREGVAPDSYLAILEHRNILREFVPAPSNTIMIDNLDRKMVGIKAEFSFDGKPETQSMKGVEGKSQVQIEGKGDVVELTFAYSDGHKVGPIRHEFKTGGAWAYKIEKYTEDELPKKIHLAVVSTNPEEALLNIVVTTNDNKQLKPPTMLIEANQTIDIGEWEAKQIQTSVVYRSKKPGPTGNYMPSETKQTLTIPPEPPPEEIAVGAPKPVDPPADDQYTVAGLWTYRDVQEMIVTGGTGRKVITLRDEGAIDGGNLLAVHPLGGVVVMPATGNYYLYPLGKSFGKRVQLEATNEEELPEAIDKWTRPKPVASAQ